MFLFQEVKGYLDLNMAAVFLFIFYLSCALKESPDEQVPRDLQAFLEVFYADDLSYATTSYEHRESIKAETPRKLEKYNLFINHSKTEEGEAPDKRPPPPPPPPPLTDPGDKVLWSAGLARATSDAAP